jgi:GNAT superfamily N-acetyltransferase
MIETETLDRFGGLTCLGFTYPKYRQMLMAATLEGPVTAVQATVDGVPAGLVLAANAPGKDAGWIYSLYVDPPYRHLGVGKQLMRHIEGNVRARGLRRISLGYLDGRATTTQFERILSACAWGPPKPERIVCRCDDRMFGAEWMLHPPKLPHHCEIFSWSELQPDDRASLIASETEHRWIEQMVDPFKYDGRCEFNSVGMRYRGEVVGWVLTQRFDERWLMYGCSYIRPDLQGRGYIIPLYFEAVRRHGERLSLFPKAMWVVPFVFPAMVRFVRRRMAPYALSIDEYRITTKML